MKFQTGTKTEIRREPVFTTPSEVYEKLGREKVADVITAAHKRIVAFRPPIEGDSVLTTSGTIFDNVFPYPPKPRFILEDMPERFPEGWWE